MSEVKVYTKRVWNHKTNKYVNRTGRMTVFWTDEEVTKALKCLTDDMAANAPRRRKNGRKSEGTQGRYKSEILRLLILEAYRSLQRRKSKEQDPA